MIHIGIWDLQMFMQQHIGGRLDAGAGWIVLGITEAYAREHMI